MSRIIVPLHLANLANIPIGTDPGFKKLYLKANWIKLYDGVSETELVLDRPLDNFTPILGTITPLDTVLTALEKLQYAITSIPPPNLTLQQVTDAGSNTTTGITIGTNPADYGYLTLVNGLISMTAEDWSFAITPYAGIGDINGTYYANLGAGILNVSNSATGTVSELSGDSGLKLKTNPSDIGGYGAQIMANLISGPLKTFQLPNQSGTFALLSDIPSSSGISSIVAGSNISVDNTDVNNPIVSATGLLLLDGSNANSNVDIGTYNIAALGFNIGAIDKKASLLTDNFTTSHDVQFQDKEYIGVADITDIPTELSSLFDDSTHRLVTDAEKSTWNSKQNAITTGTTSQYLRGDLSLSTFPSIPSVGNWGVLNYPSWTSGTPFVKMNAAGSFVLDTNTYLTSITSSNVTIALGYTPVTNARTLTINGTTYDLTADRSWTIGSYTLPIATSSILGGVKIGSGVTVGIDGTISISTNYQAPLSGTGFVKISGTTISYDNNTYVPYSSYGTNNISANNFFDGFTSVVASGTQIVLTVNSTPSYLVTGSGGQTIKLPDATTLPNGTDFYFNNNQSSGAILVNNNSNTLVKSVPSGGYLMITLIDNSTSAGNWDTHFQSPSNVSWSTNTFDYGGSITSATWNGVNVALNRGGTGANTASGARTNLGSTTIGDNFFTLTNPSAITFPRINADNTVSTLDATTFRTAIGAGTSSTSGTVTSVAALTLGTTGTDLSSTVANGTTTPVITLNVPTASATNRGVLSSTDWSTFNNKQAALSFTPYKYLNTTQSTVSGTNLETIVATDTILGNTFNSNDVMKVLFGINKTLTTLGINMRIKINTTNTLSGATQVAILSPTATASVNLVSRNFYLNGENLYGFPFTSSAANDLSTTGGSLSSTPYNTANTLYVFFTVQLGSVVGGESIQFNLANITN